MFMNKNQINIGIIKHNYNQVFTKYIAPFLIN